jgi:hypothetical protein
MSSETDPREAEAMRALDELDAAIKRSSGGSMVLGEEVAIPDVVTMCKQYHEVRPLIESSLWLVERVPRVGEKLAGAMRFLMGLADQACAIPNQ